MATNLDVLVMASAPGSGDETEAALHDAGHRVHRCYDRADRGFPCKGVRDPASCPIEQGVDVAVVVRPKVAAQPTPLEGGASCALRARVPLVEKGFDVFDPFGPWLTARAGHDVVGACERAAETGWATLRAGVDRRARQVLAAAGQPGPLDCAIERHGPRLRVALSGPPIASELRHALAVRAIDAVRADSRSTTSVDVTYRVRQ